MDESTRNDLDTAWAEFLKKEALSGGLEKEDVYKNEPVMNNFDEKEMLKVNNNDVKPKKEVKEKKDVKANVAKNETTKKEATNKEAVKTTSNKASNKTKNKVSEKDSANVSQKKAKKAEKAKAKEAKVVANKTFEEKKSKKELAADAKKEEQITELKEKVMRNMAEFENYRKRTEKEKTAMFEVGAKSIIEKLLPVIDNFERGLDAVTEEEKESAFAQGIDMIYKQLIQSLEDAGVKRIEAVGKEFNPEFHNAVMHDEDDSLGENIVSEEFQKGYMYRDSVIRHSLVKVVN